MIRIPRNCCNRMLSLHLPDAAGVRYTGAARFSEMEIRLGGAIECHCTTTRCLAFKWVKSPIR
jgi:hypothetical protein